MVQSSARKALDVYLLREGKSLTITKNKRGLKELPCGVPLSGVNFKEKLDPTFTLYIRLARKFLIQLIIFPLTLRFISFKSKPSVQIRSNALVKSIIIATVILPDIIAVSASLFKRIIGSLVQKPFLKPDCLGDRKLFFPRYQFRR